MSAHKKTDRICIIITVITIIISLVFCNGQVLGIQTKAHAIGYENRLFDRSKVHTIDIVINDWEGFIEGCENEEYAACNLVIDGEAVRNVGLRAKGNSSLSSVRSSDSSRYSFKIEFDQYEDGKTYHGLDKLCLNNIIQDNTYMKDYLAYTLMYDFRVDAPLCSYAYITVNGEDWGLYLAVEAIEDSFLERNYGSNHGDLYKPDSTGFGGGRGNGKDFSFGGFMNREGDENAEVSNDNDMFRARDFGGDMPDFGNMPQFDPENMPEDFDPSEFLGEDGRIPGFGGGMSMGSDDVKLNYTDDDIDSYSNIFNNAKTPVDKADKKRLISSLKDLKEQSDIESTVDVEKVIRYFVVHDFLVNGDSYTGQMIHNYYLYEENGKLSMIPWDYNLAFGNFQSSNASSSVNSPIDTPVSGDMSDRPMIAWIFDNEEYTEQYHRLFRQFLESIDLEKLVSDTAALIDRYVEKDPTKFCTYEEFKKGVEALQKFSTLRVKSVRGQLDGTIPSTDEGQKTDSSALVDTDGLNISDIGSMGGIGGGIGGNKGGFGRNNRNWNNDQMNTEEADIMKTANDQVFFAKMIGNTQILSDREEADTGERKQSRNSERPDFDGQPPQGFGGEMPDDFDPNSIPDNFDPDNIPEGVPPLGNTERTTGNIIYDAIGEERSSDVSENEVTSGNDNATASGNMPVGEWPDMNRFSPMNGNAQNKTAAYILLGFSALVLLAGLGFALKFKR